MLAVREGVPTAVDEAGLHALALGGLDRAATAELARELLGSALPHEQLDRIYRTTQGYPLAVCELSRLGYAADGLDAPVTVSETVERAYARDVQRCREGVRAVLLVAAADDSHDLATITSATAGLGLDLGDLETAEALGLIGLSAGRLEFRHPLVRSAVYQGAPAAARRAAHRALADALSGDWQAERRAWHRAAGTVGPDAAVAAELELTAARARARSGYGAAAQALERAAYLTPDPEARARRLFDASDALMHAGRGTRAEELLDEALEHTADPRLRARAQHLRAQLLHLRADSTRAHTLLKDEAVLVAGHDRALAADLMASAFWAAMASGDAPATLETAAMLASFAGDAHSQLDARVSALTGAALVIRGRLDAAEPYLRRSIVAAGALPTESADPFVLIFAAHSHGWLGEYAAARAASARALESAHEQAAAGAVGFAALVLTEYEYALGNLDRAVAVAAESERLARETNQREVEAWGAAYIANIAAMRGQTPRAYEFLARTQRLGVPLTSIGNTGVTWVLAAIHLAAGMPSRRSRHSKATPISPPRSPTLAVDHRVRPGRGVRPREPADACRAGGRHARRPRPSAMGAGVARPSPRIDGRVRVRRASTGVDRRLREAELVVRGRAKQAVLRRAPAPRRPTRRRPTAASRRTRDVRATAHGAVGRANASRAARERRDAARP